MWTRKELKTSAKAALKRNYWKAVLTTAVFVTLVTSTTASTGANSTAFVGTSSVMDSIASIVQQIPPVVLTVISIVIFAVTAVSFAVSILLVSPLKVGFAAFTMNAVRNCGDVSDMGRGFDVSYKRNVGTLFMVSLFTILWSLLLIIPGIVKSYEYSMIPYLLADHPEMTRKEVFSVSKAMMKGNKWKAFVLDLSFILWYALSTLTLGIVGIFYVEPYRRLTDAALYEKLKAQSAAVETVD